MWPTQHAQGLCPDSVVSYNWGHGSKMKLQPKAQRYQKNTEKETENVMMISSVQAWSKCRVVVMHSTKQSLG